MTELRPLRSGDVVLFRERQWFVQGLALGCDGRAMLGPGGYALRLVNEGDAVDAWPDDVVLVGEQLPLVEQP